MKSKRKALLFAQQREPQWVNTLKTVCLNLERVVRSFIATVQREHDQLVDILLIGWWGGKCEPASSTFWFQPIWDLHTCGQHTVNVPHLEGASVWANSSKILLCVFPERDQDPAQRLHYCSLTALPWSLHPLCLMLSRSVMSDSGACQVPLCMEFSRQDSWACQVPLCMEFARQECWSGPPGDLPNPGIESRSSTLQAGSLLPSEPPGKHMNTGVVSLSLLQGNFPTQESNRALPHCRQILCQLSYQESPATSLPFPN